MALSSAAVLTIYAAGYLRTRPAALRLEAAERPRVVIPAKAVAVARTAPPPPSAAPAMPDAPRPAAAVTRAAKHAADAATPPGQLRPSSIAATTTHGAAPAPAPTATPTAVIAASPPAAATPIVDASAAPVALEGDTPAAPAPPPPPQYKDGTYSGWGTSRHGDIEATVVIEGGRITSAAISKCWTRYPCSWVEQLPGQVVMRQSAEVDYVSGATQSVDAFYYAVVEALSKAK